MLGPYFEYFILFLTFVGAGEQAHQSRKVLASRDLKVGMTAQEVLDVMGPPDIDYRPNWNHWCYGTTIDTESIANEDGTLNPLPIKWRFFSYAEDDVVIRWGYGDRVIQIDRPKNLETPDEFHQILDVFLFLRTVFTGQGDHFPKWHPRPVSTP